MDLRTASTDYFRAMRIPPLEGRFFVIGGLREIGEPSRKAMIVDLDGDKDSVSRNCSVRLWRRIQQSNFGGNQAFDSSTAQISG